MYAPDEEIDESTKEQQWRIKMASDQNPTDTKLKCETKMYVEEKMR